MTYPDNLPISERRDELVAAIREHQVVIVAGETGSGKSTQLPKLCLEAGRGLDGMIGHTQPRRVAARTIAERVADELGSKLGDDVGYTVRFTDQVSDGTLVKVMTDGILLAEIQRDRMLRRYDTLIIDEAHERSLNIDFILGYLKQLLPQRPELKVIVTSATIDTARFADHFAVDGEPAPVIEVTGRTFPVEMRYRPLVDDDPEVEARDQVQGIIDAVEELRSEGPGDVLVFLSGEREIHDTADALRRLDLRSTEVLPLYARLSAPEQHRIFERGPDGRTRPPHRARHQRRRDVAHRARRPLRGRHRLGAHLALQPSAEGAATPDRSGVAGVGQPAGRALRPCRSRHLHPPLLRGRLRRPTRVHRSRDPAHEPGVGHPADDGDRARRRRPLPVRRAARIVMRSATGTGCSTNSQPCSHRSTV